MVPNGTHSHKVEVSWDQVFSGDLPANPAQRLFTATVITVAAQAKAALPEANGRVDRARDLVLGGLVSRNADASFTIRSQSERGKTYTVTADGCECPDAAKHEDGRCKHVVATWIWRKARKVVEAQLDGRATETPQHAPQATITGQDGSGVSPQVSPTLPEAPASCNVYVTLTGRKVQVTLRDQNEQRMLARLEQLLQRFPAEEEGEQEPPEGWCSVHQCQMKQHHNQKGVWWSHKTDSGWCHGNKK